MSAPKVLVPLAADFEEIEAVTIIDVLRRAGVEVVSAGLSPGPVTGSHGITVEPDATLSSLDPAGFDAIVLPGGMPGADHLRTDPEVQRFLAALANDGKWVGAICAAPIALAPSGIAKDRSLTCYPGFGERIPGARHREDRVVVDGRVVTSRGPGTALEFALTLVEMLVGKEPAADLEKGMLVRRSEEAWVEA